MNESRHTCKHVTSHMCAHIDTSRHIYQRITSTLSSCMCERAALAASHIWMRHVTYMNELGHTCKWVTSHIWMSHVTHANESRHTSKSHTTHYWYKWRMCHFTHHTNEWVISHMRMSHVTRRRVTPHTTQMNDLHTWMGQVTHINESRHVCDRLCVWSRHVWRLCVWTHKWHGRAGHTHKWIASHLWMSHLSVEFVHARARSFCQRLERVAWGASQLRQC